MVCQRLCGWEEILENRTVAIYTVDSWQRFARLVASSGSMRSRLTVSMRLEEYAQMVDAVKEGKVWRNTDAGCAGGDVPPAVAERCTGSGSSRADGGCTEPNGRVL